MDNNTNTGAIKGKIPLCDLAAKYHDAYTAIALIHHFGSLKYGYYNWYNDPENCDGCFYNNVNAIFRHMTAHRIGKFIDPESHLPHIFHACCRAGMLITIYYRICSISKLKPLAPKKDKNARLDVTSQLTTEELLVLSKDHLVPEYKDLNDLSDHIYELLCTADNFDERCTPDGFFDNTTYDEVEDLVLSVWRYAIKALQCNRVSYDVSILDEKLQHFIAENRNIYQEGNV